MAQKKKKQLFDSIMQGAAGALNGMPTWDAPAAPPTPEPARPLTQAPNNSAPLQTLSIDTPALDAAWQQRQQDAEKATAGLPRANVPLGKPIEETDEEASARNQVRLGKPVIISTEDEIIGNDDIGDYIRQRDEAAREWADLSFGDVLKNPIYAGSTLLNYLGYGAEDVYNMVARPDRSQEIDRRVAAYNEATDYKPDAFTATVDRGAANFNAGVGNTLDFLVGENLKRLGWEDNPVSKFADSLRSDQAVREGDYQRVREGKGKAGQTFMDLGSAAVEALPDMILMMLSAGTSGAANGAGALTRGGTRLLGSEAAGAGVSRLAGQAALARQIAASSARNPAFWTSFTRSTGNYYYDARQNGASEREAALYALLAGTLNSQIEAGSGFQRLPFDLPNSPSALRAWVHSMFEEGGEEVVQGVVERVLQNASYDAGNPYFSVKDENAIFNPLTAAKEFGMGAGVAGILGAPSSINQGAYNMLNRPRAANTNAETETPAEARPAAPVEQTPQNATESPVLNPAPQTPAYTEKTESAPVRSETRQYDDPWENILNMYLGDENAPVTDVPQVIPKNEGTLTQEEADAKARALTEKVGRPETPSWMPTEPQAESTPEAQTFKPEDHIDNRTDEYIAKRSTKPFQHEHPELHDNFVVVAKDMQELLYASSESDMPGRKGGTRAWYPEPIRKLMQATGESRPKLMQVLQDIIDNHGAEDYATAKRVEKVLDELLTNGYDAYDPSGRRHVQPDSDYLAKKDAIDGAQDRNSLNAYIEEHYLRTLEGETEDDLKSEWEALQIKARMEQMLGRPLTEADLDSITNPELVEKLRLALKVESENAGLQPQTDANGLPEGQGAMSTAFPYREVPSQTNSTNGIFTEEERQTVNGLRPEDQAHQVRTNEDVDYHAKERFESDYDGEKADLYQSDKEWDVTDIAVAWRILEQETQKARETGDWDEVVRLKKIYRSKASNWGQVGHEMGRHAHTAADIVSEAAETLLGDGDLRGNSDAQTRLDEIAQFADEWESISPNDTENMLALIRRLNAARRTGGFFGGRNMSRTLENTINAVAQQEGGAQFLRDIAEGQLRAMSADMARLSPMNAIKSVRYLSMLSKLNTTMRNLLGNTVFDITETLSNNVVTPLDMFLALRTGRRTTATDLSWASQAKRQGAREAAQRAYIETALDVDLGDTSNRFEQRTGRTFKMSGNPVERFLSTMEKWQRYMLTVTDEFAKGGTRAEQQRGIDRLTESGRLEEGALDEWAEETARQRTFQNGGRISEALRGLRDAGNALSIRDRRGGSFGLGDAILPFAQVPGNIAGQFMNYSPLGLAHGAAEVIGVLRAGENATAEQQARAVRDVGRGMTGTGLVALFAAMAANGLLKVAGDDDKDREALERSEGISGTQLNLDAAARWLRGEDPTWQDGDDLMSIGFLEPFNGDMAMGYLIAEAYKDADEDGGVTGAERTSSIVNANVEAALQAVMDLPAMSTLKNIGDAFEYSTADTAAGKVADASVQFAGDTAASFVPNVVAGIAQGMDNGVTRETRTSDKHGAAAALENAVNTIKSKIPGLRETLPQALDSWGQGKQTTASPFQNWLNANILPGSVTKYDTNEVNQELYRLMDAQDVKAPARNPVKSVQTEDGKKELSHDERRTYQETAGSTMFEELQNLMGTEQYSEMTDAERATAWSEIMSFGRATGEQAVGGDKSLPSWAERGEGSIAEKAGFFSILQSVKQALDEDDRDKGGAIIGAVLDRGLSEEDTLGVLAQGLTGNNAGTLEKIQNADDPLAFAKNYFGVYTARQTLPEDLQDNNAPQLQAILDSGVNDRTAMEQFKIVLGDSTTYTKIETLRKAGMPLDNIVAFYNARNEDYAVSEKTGNPRKRNEKEQIAWLMETYGYNYDTAKYVYDVFAGKKK